VSSAGFIDLHAHVLAGVDDGPSDEAEALELLERLASEGVTTVVATPHVDGRYASTPAVVRERIDVLAPRSPIDILPGAEIHLGQLDVVLDSGAGPYTLGGSGTLLLEVEGSIAVSIVEDARIRLAEAGVRVLLGHAERWQPLRDDPFLADGLVASGVSVQVTACALLGRIGSRSQRCAWALLDRGRVHVVASDAHALGTRAPEVAAAARALDRRYGEGAADVLLREHPGAVLAGATPPAFIPPRRTGLLARLGFSRR
jgi:protein-tyrosine phosphatase